MSKKRIAIECELQLLRWADTSNGGKTVTFQVDELKDAHPFKDYAIRSGKRAGQRFMAVLVELGPDEQPVSTSAPAPAKGGSLARSAAMVGQDVDFQQYVDLHLHGTVDSTGDDGEVAAEFVRKTCGVASRAELDSNPEAAQRFHALMRDFNEWKGAQIG